MTSDALRRLGEALRERGITPEELIASGRKIRGALVDELYGLFDQEELMDRSEIDISVLTPEERLVLLEEIWDSLQPEEVPVSEAQRRELDRRLDELEADSVRGIPWEEVLSRIRERSG